MNWKKIGIVVAVFLVLVVLFMYGYDRSKEKQRYIEVYNRCVENQDTYLEEIDGLLEHGETGKAEYDRRRKAFNDCNGCYHGCGGCNNPDSNLGFGEWFIEKIFYREHVICDALCRPYCMSAP